jgi:hypothetical protein
MLHTHFIPRKGLLAHIISNMYDAMQNVGEEFGLCSFVIAYACIIVWDRITTQLKMEPCVVMVEISGTHTSLK